MAQKQFLGCHFPLPTRSCIRDFRFTILQARAGKKSSSHSHIGNQPPCGLDVHRNKLSLGESIPLSLSHEHTIICTSCGSPRLHFQRYPPCRRHQTTKRFLHIHNAADIRYIPTGTSAHPSRMKLQDMQCENVAQKHRSRSARRI
jgi:hypothetical protein